MVVVSLCCFQGHFEGKNQIRAAHLLGSDEPAVSDRCEVFLFDDDYQLDLFASYNYVFLRHLCFIVTVIVTERQKK